MARRKERRKFPCRDCLMVCRCEGKGFRSDGHIVDISCGGVGIVGTRKLPAEGVELQLSILLPGSSIKLTPSVV